MEQVNPKTNAEKEMGAKIAEKLTTESLGIADSKEKDLVGYVLNQKDISEATTKILSRVGIAESDIRTVKVGADIKTKKLRIICEVKFKAAFGKSEEQETPWYDFDGEKKKTAFNKTFYEALYNKVYHGKKKHLKMKVVHRANPNKPDDVKKFVQFELDPEILIAFVYNIPFTDRYYKISVVPTGWVPNSVINDMSGRERRIYKSMKNEWEKEGITNCAIYVTFRNAPYIDERDENGVLKKSFKGFSPNQVDAYYKMIGKDKDED